MTNDEIHNQVEAVRLSAQGLTYESRSVENERGKMMAILHEYKDLFEFVDPADDRKNMRWHFDLVCRKYPKRISVKFSDTRIVVIWDSQHTTTNEVTVAKSAIQHAIKSAQG